MNRSILSWATALIVAVLATGCAHPILLTPDISRAAEASPSKVDKRVGLRIPAEDLQREVTSAGGGGDKVSYKPYRDLEAPIYFSLGQVFSQVSKVSGPADPKIQAEKIDYVISPRISTTSYSGSLLTWPPTLFTVTLTCKVTDANDMAVAQVEVTGDGRAEFEEFKGNFSLSAKRAAEDAIAKLIKALAQAAPGWK
jgi:hypothetical protein